MRIRGQCHPSRALPPGKNPPVPTGEEVGWASEPFWTQRLQEKSCTSSGDRTLVTQSVDIVLFTELPHLLSSSVSLFIL
jgi:hypothetical protein